MSKDHKKESQNASPLLERYLQKTTTDRMQGIDEEIIAKAIRSMLCEDDENDKNKRLN